MTTPHDPPDDRLDAEEQRLARVLCTLPSGAPPSALDAKILATARDAAAPRRRRPMLWGLGTAAAAVLAVGVIWHMQYQPAPPPMLPESPVAFPETAPVERERREQSREETSAEAQPQTLGEQSAKRDAATPPPPPPPAPPPSAELQRASPGPAAPSPAEPQPSEDPAIVFEEPAPMDTPAEPAPATEPGPPGITARPAPAPPVEPATPAAAGSAAAAPTSDAEAAMSAPAAPQGYATQADAESQAVLPPVHTDEALAPAEWLARIRARLAAGDRADAIASLRRFRAVHPLIALPDDLEPLLE